jgi:hypothetical protein
MSFARSRCRYDTIPVVYDLLLLSKRPQYRYDAVTVITFVTFSEIMSLTESRMMCNVVCARSWLRGIFDFVLGIFDFVLEVQKRAKLTPKDPSDRCRRRKRVIVTIRKLIVPLHSHQLTISRTNKLESNNNNHHESLYEELCARNRTPLGNE